MELGKEWTPSPRRPRLRSDRFIPERTDGFQEIATPPDDETEYQYVLRKVLLGDRRSIIFPHFKDTSPYAPPLKIAHINRSAELVRFAR